MYLLNIYPIHSFKLITNLIIHLKCYIILTKGKLEDDIMDIRQLETFVAVVENKSFTKASEMLYVSQPTVSNHISNLEKELDTVLFIRTKRNVTLTKSGDILYEHAKNIILAYRTMTSELKSYNQNTEGHLNIYASSVPRKFLLPKLLKDFSAKYPNVSYSLVNDDSQTVLDGLMIGETDFGFVGIKVDSPKLSYHQLMEDELVLVASEELSVRHDKDMNISLDDIVKYPIIMREEGSGTRSILENELNRLGIDVSELNLFAVIEDPSTILQMVECGLGCSVISKFEADSIVENNKIKKYKLKDLNLKRHFYFVYNTDMQYVPINRIFKSFILNMM